MNKQTQKVYDRLVENILPYKICEFAIEIIEAMLQERYRKREQTKLTIGQLNVLSTILENEIDVSVLSSIVGNIKDHPKEGIKIYIEKILLSLHPRLNGGDTLPLNSFLMYQFRYIDTASFSSLGDSLNTIPQEYLPVIVYLYKQVLDIDLYEQIRINLGAPDC